MALRSRPRFTVGLPALAMAFALLVGGCGDVDPELAGNLATAPSADDDTVASLPPATTDEGGAESTTTEAPPTTASTTTESPTTSLDAGPAEPVAADDAALAAALEVGAVLVEETFDANVSADPIGGLIAAARDSAAAYRAIPTTEATAAVLADLAENADASAATLARYEPLLADPLTAAAASQDFLTENQELTELALEIDSRLLALIAERLEVRGGAVAEYLLASGEVQQTATASITELLAAVQLLTVDPVGGISAMAGPVETIGALGPVIDQLPVPPVLADYHERYVTFVDEYATVFGAIIDDVENNRNPSAADLRTMQSLASFGPELIAERSRLTAAALRGELN